MWPCQYLLTLSRGSSRVTLYVNAQLTEDTMQKPVFSLGSLFAGLMMLLLLGACAEVKVTCPPAGGGGVCDTDECPPGGCNQPYVPWPNGSPVGFKNTVTGVIITAPTNLICNAVSNKCQSTPGNCGFGKTCRNWYRPTDSFCHCGCP